MFGKKETAPQKNVPIYTTDQIIVPDGYKAEYVGVVELTLSGANGSKTLDKYQEHVNQSGVDAVFGVRVQSIGNLHLTLVYGTGVKFVPAE
jgi:hypothetical protein